MRAARLVLLGSLACGACAPGELIERTVGGATMGTSWSATCVLRANVGEAELARALEGELAAVGARASTWDATSELARFNAHRSTDSFVVSRELSELVAYAVTLAHLTGGAFDPTVLPLVRALGFAAEGESALDEATRAAAREHVGCSKLRVDPGRLTKLDPELELDLSGVAPGDAVDRLGAILDSLGARAWLVELGGEVRARGAKLDGSAWTVGIEVPREGAEFGDGLLRRVALVDRAIATSGGYRRSRGAGAERRHHLVDPRTGVNPTHDTVSVSVIAPTCARADGLATALLVMGADEGLRWLETQSDVEALFVERTSEPGGRHRGEHAGAGFELRATPNFPSEPAR